VRRLGWWRDGAAPGDRRGTTLIAGHVDSATQGNGTFKRLVASRVGTRVRVTTGDGKVRTYRVTSVRRILKAALPAGIFTQRGKRRLVLVTCGGPFDAAIGHYRDNIVVVAVPV
jgi:LPXTG-site transpeptidase (sortase) family protein